MQTAYAYAYEYTYAYAITFDCAYGRVCELHAVEPLKEQPRSSAYTHTCIQS